VWSPAERAAPRERSARFGRSPGLLLALLFLLVNFAARFDALRATGLPATLLGVVVVLAAVACLARPAWLGPALTAFGSSFFLYGFHSYSSRNQAFELVVTAFVAVLVLRLLRGPQTPLPTALAAILPFAVLYALAATFSLLLLPPRVLEHRAFLEGSRLAQALLTAFPKDPLYPIASVNRLWLFLAFAVALSAQAEAGALYRRLVRGIAWAVIVAVVLGLLDFAGVLSLAHYNQSQVFFGAGYRRLQSTFGNPGWFACFVACGVPFMLLEWSEPRRWLRLVIAASFPLTAASLFLSGARASWLAGLGMLAALAALRFSARRLGRPFPAQSPLHKSVLAASLAVFALLVVFGVLARRLGLAPAISSLPPSGSKASRARSARVARPHVSAARGGRVRHRARTRASSPRPRLRELQHAPARSARAARLAGHARRQHGRPPGPDRDRCSTTATTPTSRCSRGPACSGSCSGSRSWPHHSRSRFRAFARAPAPLPVAVALGLLTFHLYGLFQEWRISP
jgi:hypothetical protein